jgi:hypothetical protein
MKMVEKSFDDLDSSERALGGIKESLARISAPGLDYKRRMNYAAKVEREFEEMHGRNEMLAFVTQSYFSSSAAETAKVRFLDSVETARRWAAIYQETADAHGAVLSFARQWLNYAKTALGHYAARELPMTPPSPEESSRMFTAALSSFDGDRAALQMEMDYLAGAVDMARLGWDGRSLWQCAVFLLEEGRSAEAGILMKAAAGDFDGKDMPSMEAASFLKDYARVLSTADLCHFPDYGFAETVLENAAALCGADDEIREIREKILKGEIAELKNRARRDRLNLDRLVEWKIARHEAIGALLDGDVISAMRMVWRMIRERGEFVPDLAAAQLDWLAAHMERFFGALDEPYRSGIDELLSEIASRPDIIGKFPIMYSVGFVSALESHGLNVLIEEAGRNEAALA